MPRIKSIPKQIRDMVYIHWEIEDYTLLDRKVALQVARSCLYGLVAIIPATRTHEDKLAVIIRTNDPNFKELLRDVEYYELLPDHLVLEKVDYYFTNFVIEEVGYPFLKYQG
jgi:hypothetical protein